MKYLIFYTKKVKMQDFEFKNLLEMSEKINIDKKFFLVNPKDLSDFDFENYKEIKNTIITQTKKNFQKSITQKAFFEAYSSKEFAHIKPLILLRDTGECIITQKKGKKDVHHIDFNPFNNNPRNLIAISETAHLWLHKNEMEFDFKKYINEKEEFNLLIDKQMEEFKSNKLNNFSL